MSGCCAPPTPATTMATLVYVLATPDGDIEFATPAELNAARRITPGRARTVVRHLPIGDPA